jgi:hypothetical protein
MEKTIIKAGDKVKICLVASTTPHGRRVSNGVTQDSYTGMAGCDLAEGQPFIIDVENGEYIQTSAIQYVGKGMFATKNSTYSVEKL